ncbi:MAG: hypothetical protein AAB225_03155 [Acidobacteriota bacterium]
MLFPLGLLGAMAAGFGAWMMLSPKETAARRERRRRLRVNARGRTTGATLIDIREEAVHYSYSVRGLEYTASQDLTGLGGFVPGDLSGLTGHASVKYLPENPANSILVCEQWSGLHTRPPA